jgi:hypothetical protein
MTDDLRCPCDECNPPPEPPNDGWTSLVLVGFALIVVILSMGSCWA